MQHSGGVQEVVLFLLLSPQDLTAGKKADSARLRRSRRFEGTLTHLHANIPSPTCRIHPDWPSSLLESSPAASAPHFTLHSLLVTTGSQRSFRFWLPVLPRRERAQQPPLNHRCVYPFSQSPPRAVHSTVTRCENSKEGRLTVPALALTQDAEAHVRCRLTCLLLTASPVFLAFRQSPSSIRRRCASTHAGGRCNRVPHMHVSRSRTAGKRESEEPFLSPCCRSLPHRPRCALKSPIGVCIGDDCHRRSCHVRLAGRSSRVS
jgi:hypothetical protein